MPIIEKTGRLAAIALAVLFISLSVFAIFGVWFELRRATDATVSRASFGGGSVLAVVCFHVHAKRARHVLRERRKGKF